MSNTAPQAAQIAPAPPPAAAGQAAAAPRRTFGRRLLVAFVGLAGFTLLLFVLNGLLDKVMVSDPPPFRPLRWLVVSVVVGAAGVAVLELLRVLTEGKRTAPYVFVSPFFLMFAIFGLFPILFSAYLSFQQWDPATGLGGMKWVGLENYRVTAALRFHLPADVSFWATPWKWLTSLVSAEDKWFWLSLWNTFWIAIVSGLPQHLVGMPLAYFFHVAYKRFRNAITGAYFLPFITSSVAISLIFTTLFSKDFGVVNATLDSLSRLPGIGGFFPDPQHHIDWLGKSPYTKPAVSFVVWWRYLGWNTVLYLSALQAISADLFEAAEMDGASRWQTFRHVVVPLLKPMMLFAVTLTIIGNLQLFEEPYIILGPNGGVEQSGMTTAMYMYKTGFDYNDFGTACAISWLLFVLIAVLTYANQKIFARSSGVEEGAA
jgi:multiple sugar transport system permease protein